MHANRAQHAVIADQDDQTQLLLDGSRQLVARHLKAAVARKGHDRARAIVQRRSNRSGNAVAAMTRFVVFQ